MGEGRGADRPTRSVLADHAGCAVGAVATISTWTGVGPAAAVVASLTAIGPTSPETAWPTRAAASAEARAAAGHTCARHDRVVAEHVVGLHSRRHRPVGTTTERVAASTSGTALPTVATLASVRTVAARAAAGRAATVAASAADAVHLATAVGAGADRFITNNRRHFPKTVSEIDITYPNDL
jgi:predicted nucleic acid-binding protein